MFKAIAKINTRYNRGIVADAACWTGAIAAALAAPAAFVLMLATHTFGL